MVPKLAAVFFVALFHVSLVLPAGVQPSEESAALDEACLQLADRAAGATVAIDVVRRVSGRSAIERSQGSGFIVASRPGRLLIATAAHVVPEGAQARVRWPDEKSTRASAVWRQRDLDLALYETHGPEHLHSEPLERSARRFASGERVCAMGFPATGQVTNMTAEPGRLLTHRNALSARVQARASRGQRARLAVSGVWLHSAPVLPGASGGPLLGADGRVIGLHVGSVTGWTGACLEDESGLCLRLPAHLAAGLDPLWPAVEQWLQQP